MKSGEVNDPSCSDAASRERIESLFRACEAGDLAKVQEILGQEYHDVDGGNRWGADSDPRGWRRSPLEVAIQGGHLELARWLLDNGAVVNRQNRFGDTALSGICRPPLHAHWLDAIELLMSRGADPTIRNAEGETALDFARKISVNWKKAKHLFAAYAADA